MINQLFLIIIASNKDLRKDPNMDLGKQLDIFQWIYGIDVDLRVDKNTPDNSFKGRYKIEHCKSLLLFYLIFDGEL